MFLGVFPVNSFYFFFFWLHLWHMEVPRPGMECVPQGLEPLQSQRRSPVLCATKEFFYPSIPNAYQGNHKLLFPKAAGMIFCFFALIAKFVPQVNFFPKLSSHFSDLVHTSIPLKKYLPMRSQCRKTQTPKCKGNVP